MIITDSDSYLSIGPRSYRKGRIKLISTDGNNVIVDATGRSNAIKSPGNVQVIDYREVTEPVFASASELADYIRLGSNVNQNPKITMPANFIFGERETIFAFDDISNTVGSEASIAIDNVNFIQGTGSMKITTTAGNDGEAIKTANFSIANYNSFRFSVYINNIADANFVHFRFLQGAGFFRASVKPYKNGWNYWTVLKSQFVVAGSPAPTWGAPFSGIKVTADQNGTGVFVISVDFIEGFTTEPVPAVFLSYDGQYENVFDNALPVMKQHNIPATMYTQTGTVGQADVMTLEQLRDLEKYGWSVANHSDTHVELTTLSAAAQEAELVVARDKLINWGFNGAHHLAFPYGSYNANTFIAMANAGIVTGRIAGGVADPFIDIRRISADNLGGADTLATAKAYIDAAIAAKTICSLYFHRIVTGVPADDTEWNKDDYIALMEYIVEKQIQPINIVEFYKIYELSQASEVSQLKT